MAKNSQKNECEFLPSNCYNTTNRNILSKEIGLKLNPFFNQYLRDTRIPVLEYSIENNVLFYRWNNVVDGFDMPVEIESNNEIQWLYPTETWQTTIVKSPKITIDEDYYISIKNLN